MIEEFEKEKNKITPDRDLKRLNQLRKQIRQLRLFPNYWGIGMLLTFIFFMLSLFFSFVWLTNTETLTRDNAELAIVVTFQLAWTALLVVGISTIVDIFGVMRKEFENIKKKQKEVKETTNEDLEKIKKDIEELKEREDRRVS